MNGPRNPQLAAAIREIWQRAYTAIEQQISEIEQAANSLRLGTLDEPTRATAENAAHKLAGSAGTFGFAAVSEIASALERLLKSPTPADLQSIADLALALRTQLQETAEAAGAVAPKSDSHPDSA